MIIQGAAINLRPLTESDIETVRVWRNSDAVSKFMLSRGVITADQQKKWFQKISGGNRGFYWLITSKAERPLGLVSIGEVNKVDLSAEPGLYIGEERDRNSMIGMEAYFHVLQYAFEYVGLKKILGTVLSNNLPALKMNVGFGFTDQSIERSVLEVDGKLLDIHRIQLIPQDFYKSKMYRFFKKQLNPVT